MGELITGDDALPAESNVGPWVEDKHHALREYLKYHAKPRAGYRHRAYIEVFCGSGRGQLRNTGQFIDGSPVVAWKCSVEEKAPFSELYIADRDPKRRQACAERLRRLGAPVIEFEGDAITAAAAIVARLDPYGLHFSFVDPYSLGELRLELLRTLASVKRMDIMVHISAMDLFRNFDRNLAGERREFDAFAPGWQQHVAQGLPKDERRRAAIDYWKTQVDAMGLDATSEMKAVRNRQNRDMYWLLVLSRHPLGAKFWRIVLESDPQRRLL
jgi:three-Cys-motif partner protein